MSDLTLFIDTETNDKPRDWQGRRDDTRNWPRVVQVAWILARSFSHRTPLQMRLCKPNGWKIASGAQRVHGISTRHAAANGVPIDDVLHDLNVAIEQADVIVAHNTGFDLPVLNCEFLRAGVTSRLLSRRVCCTMKSSTDYVGLPGPYGFKWPKLQELHFRLFAKTFEDAHDAGGDTEACFRCYWELVKRGVVNL